MDDIKKSFVLYCDLKHTVNLLTDEQAGVLFKTLFQYVNDENPVITDPFIKLAFEPIKQSLKRDLKKYESKLDKKSKAGILGNLKRWNEDLYDEVNANRITIKKAQSIAESRKASQCDESIANIAVSVNVSDSVNDNVNVSVDDEKKKNTDVGKSYFPIEKCKAMYLENERVLKAVADNPKNKITLEQIPKRLMEFNQFLLEASKEIKQYDDYCSHFKSWHKAEKKATTLKRVRHV